MFSKETKGAVAQTHGALLRGLVTEGAMAPGPRACPSHTLTRQEGSGVYSSPQEAAGTAALSSPSLWALYTLCPVLGLKVFEPYVFSWSKSPSVTLAGQSLGPSLRIS